MNEIKKALDSGMKNIHFDRNLVLNNNRHSRMNHVLKKAVASLAVLALVTFCTTTEAAQSVFAYVYRSIANIMEKNEKVDEYTTVIGKSITDNGITVTLNDAIVSEEKLILSLNFSDGKERENRRDSVFWGDEIKVYMDGKEMPVVGLSGTGQELNEYTFNNIVEYYIGNIAPEEQHEFKIVVTKVEEKNKVTSGNWTFDFVASSKAMVSDTKVVMLDNTLNYGNYNIIFEKYVSNSYEKLLYVTYSDGTGYGDRGNEFYLIGYDDLGNKVSLYAQPDYYDKQGIIFICEGGTDISEEASTLTLQTDDEWPYEYDAAKESVTFNIE